MNIGHSNNDTAYSMKDYHHVLMIRIRQRNILYKPKQVSHEEFLYKFKKRSKFQ